MSGSSYRKQGMIWRRSLALLLWISAALAAPAGAGGAVGVVYPDIREPFRSVFLSIARGVSDELGQEAVLRPLAEPDGTQEIGDWIKDNELESVIALGSRGPDLSDEFDGKPVPVVVGAVHMSPELQDRRYHGIALSPDPALLFGRLKAIAPGVKRVTVVYHRDRDRWIIEQAQPSAARLGLELNAVAVDRLQEAAGVYRDILATQASGTEALWLLQDGAVLDEQAVLPMILKLAWDHKSIVFSSNPSHVRRGVLFALYPDNYRMGRSLGAMARLVSEGKGGHGMELLRDLSMALNVRTAEHLGLKVSRELLREVELVFPLR